MKDQTFSFTILIVLILLFVFSNDSSSNWQRGKSMAVSTNSLTVSNSSQDSLPIGLPNDILKDLRDQNGNKIIPEEDPEGDAIQRKVFNGFDAGGYFGISVNSAGDVNGDGYSDVIIGGQSVNPNYGKAYIYYGGLYMNTVADIVFSGETSDSRLGNSVNGAGDLNGDGYDDVLVGAFGYNGFTGRAYVHFGGQNMDNIPDLVLNEGSYSDFFGFSLGSAGDINGDGYADAFVGLTGYSSGGRVFIYYGGLSMDNVADFILTGENLIDNFGISASAGDINGDGFSDLAVGAVQYNSYQGRAYIYYGGPGLDNTADLIITGENVGDNLGYCVSSGDLNGDGYDDVAVGAYGNNSSQGKVYIYFGGPGIDNTADLTVVGESANSDFGFNLSAGGDINGDGYCDLAIGAIQFNSYTGMIYLCFGGSNMNAVFDLTISGEVNNDYFGCSIAASGDVNGDGYSDIIAGAYGYNSNTGRAYLFDYFPKGELYPDLTMTGEGTGNFFGHSVSNAGDVNADGYDDVIVGAIQLDVYGPGKAYIYYGGVTMNTTPDATLAGELIGNQFGRSVCTAGDVNGDGYSDVIIGASSYSSYTGRAYVYFGGSTFDTIPDVIMTGQATSNNFGLSVSDAGDVNGDGYSDVILGAPGYGPSNQGGAFIYFGGGAMDNGWDVYMTGEGSSYNLGTSVSGAGDVNGDGYADVIIGAPGYNSNQGRATVYFGGASMNGSPDVYFYGEGTSNSFGYSVSSAGDVNADGFDDMIVGSYYYGSGIGRAYIYYGSLNIDNSADVVMGGPSSSSYFGVSVSNAGDVNLDGYSDVTVGAYGFTSYTGRTYVYLGGAAMNSASDLIITGEYSNDYFGYSVSGAGDINGDGYSDLITGAYGKSSRTGKAYIYYGSAISAKPILLYVKDVPNDQGGKVNLKWARSSYDVAGSGLITDYVVQRSYPPSGGNYSWENVAYIPATREPFYTYTASTPFDSSTNNNGNFFFRITARTSNPDQFWRSAILSGRSIDNLAPLIVSPFTAASVAGNVRLAWKRSSAPDILNYVLYRSTSPTIDPNTEPVFATTTDTTYLDTSPLSGLYYYFIIALDIHFNKSPVSVTESPSITLDLTVFIAGLYNSESNSQVNDTITVELRNSTSPYAIADASSAVVSASGSAVLKFGNAADGSYYIAVKHRNSIETWSAVPLAFSRTSAVNYDMSSSASQAYGSNQLQVDTSPVRFAIYSGDLNQDGIIDASDVGAVDNDAANYVTGYVPSDLNGDGFVDGTDFAIADNNAANFIGVIRP